MQKFLQCLPIQQNLLFASFYLKPENRYSKIKGISPEIVRRDYIAETKNGDSRLS